MTGPQERGVPICSTALATSSLRSRPATEPPRPSSPCERSGPHRRRRASVFPEPPAGRPSACSRTRRLADAEFGIPSPDEAQDDARRSGRGDAGAGQAAAADPSPRTPVSPGWQRAGVGPGWMPSARDLSQRSVPAPSEVAEAVSSHGVQTPPCPAGASARGGRHDAPWDGRVVREPETGRGFTGRPFAWPAVFRVKAARPRKIRGASRRFSPSPPCQPRQVQCAARQTINTLAQ